MMDFSYIASELKARAKQLLPEWLPGGRFLGNEYHTSSIYGGPGKSLKYNIEKGCGEDFSTGERFGDMIDLYCKINNVSPKDALIYWQNAIGLYIHKGNGGGNGNGHKPVKTPGAPIRKPNLALPGRQALLPDFKHPQLGTPSAHWEYKSIQGATLFFVARYDTESGKEFRPFIWTDDKGWISKGYPFPRPLYGLEYLNKDGIRDQTVFIVEGEKACEAARVFIHSPVLTWPNGASSVEKCDWSYLYGFKKVILWPDNDSPGLEAMESLAAILAKHVGEVKIIACDPDLPKGFDAADALKAGWDYEKFFNWAKPRIKTVSLQQHSQQVPHETQESGKISLHHFYLEHGVEVNGNGIPYNNLANIAKIMTSYNELKSIVWLDEYEHKIYTTFQSDSKREWNDRDDLNLLHLFQSKLGFHNLKKGFIQEAVLFIANINKVNPIKEYLNSLNWDGKDRIETFFSTYFGSKDSIYERAIAKNFWASIINRALKPGCKVDSMVILEGMQGVGKSKALSIIGGKYHTEIAESVLSKDFILGLTGKLIVEICEMDSFNRAEVNTIKRIVTCSTDRIRVPYGKNCEDFPRSCIFVGTTNDEEYLRDQTGARRFWPIKCYEIDLNALKNDRDQLFAQAVTLLNHPYWIVPNEETQAEHDLRQETDYFDRKIASYTEFKDEIDVLEIWESCLGQGDRIATRMDKMRIGKSLRRIGFIPVTTKRNGVIFWGFKKK